MALGPDSMSMLWRMIVVPFAFVIAALASITILLSLGYERFVQAAAQAQGGEIVDAILGILGHGLTIAAGATVLPALAFVIIGEVARIRSGTYYVLAGGVALAAWPWLARLDQQAQPAAQSFALGTWQVFATAGFAGGFIYWLLAGRRA